MCACTMTFNWQTTSALEKCSSKSVSSSPFLFELKCCCSDVNIWTDVTGYFALCHKAKRAAPPLNQLLLWIEYIVNTRTDINPCHNRVCIKASGVVWQYQGLWLQHSVIMQLHVYTGKFLSHFFHSAVSAFTYLWHTHVVTHINKARAGPDETLW